MTTNKDKLPLPLLQAKNMKCVFCGISNKKVVGGYFKKKFVCKTCNFESRHLDFLLGDDRNGRKSV